MEDASFKNTKEVKKPNNLVQQIHQRNRVPKINLVDILLVLEVSLEITALDLMID